MLSFKASLHQRFSSRKIAAVQTGPQSKEVKKDLAKEKDNCKMMEMQLQGEKQGTDKETENFKETEIQKENEEKKDKEEEEESVGCWRSLLVAFSWCW